MGVSYNPRIVTDGLVFCLDAASERSYPGAGTTWYDLTTNNNNWSLINGPSFSNNGNGSILFDGTNDYANVNNFNEDSNQDLSVMVWVYPITLDGGSADGFDYSWIINKRDDASDQQWQMIFRSVANANNFFFRAGLWDDSPTQNSIFVSGNTEIFQNQWYHLTLTFNSSNSEIRGYVNGIFDNLSGTLGGTGNRKTGSRALVGTKAAWSNSYHLRGNIAIVNIYNRTLSDQEILQNYKSTKGRFGL